MTNSNTANAAKADTKPLVDDKKRSLGVLFGIGQMAFDHLQDSGKAKSYAIELYDNLNARLADRDFAGLELDEETGNWATPIARDHLNGNENELGRLIGAYALGNKEALLMGDITTDMYQMIPDMPL